jgi:hypothetical protein
MSGATSKDTAQCRSSNASTKQSPCSLKAADVLASSDEEPDREVGDGQASRATSNNRASTSGPAQQNGVEYPNKSVLLEERVQPRRLEELPPLFTRLEERPAEPLQYLGVSFGLTAPLLKFWQRLGFVVLWLRQQASDVTGEHTCVVLKPLASPDIERPVCPLLTTIFCFLPGAEWTTFWMLSTQRLFSC